MTPEQFAQLPVDYVITRPVSSPVPTVNTYARTAVGAVYLLRQSWGFDDAVQPLGRYDKAALDHLVAHREGVTVADLNKCDECCPVAGCEVCGPCPRHDGHTDLYKTVRVNPSRPRRSAHEHISHLPIMSHLP